MLVTAGLVLDEVLALFGDVWMRQPRLAFLVRLVVVWFHSDRKIFAFFTHKIIV